MCSNMADTDACDNSNTEIELDTILSVDFCDFVRACVFPQCVCVTAGSFLNRGAQISVGDVLLLKSCDSGQVTLAYRNEQNLSWTEVNVGLDYDQKFHVLPPKDDNTDKRVSMVMYPTIADLMLDCPTYFEATTPYYDPYLPAMSVKSGSRFWFGQIVKNSKEGVDRLKVRDESGNILFLSLECRGNFSPLKDDKEYTVKELVELATVPRRLQVVKKETYVGDNSGNKGNVVESTGTADEYTAVIKLPKQRLKSASSFSSLPSQLSDLNTSQPSDLNTSLSSDPGDTKPSCLLTSFSGTVHLLKYEYAVAVSPYNDPETTWTIPTSANLKVRTYSQDDYEVPAPRSQLLQNRVPLPISQNSNVPKFRAPSTPPMLQPLVPININSFVDIYCSTFPVRAKIINTSEAPQFFQNKLKNIAEVIVYRLDDNRRLYVKDANSDTVYSLSQDLKLSFIEYPEKFRTISELLLLPIGTEVTVLEDIAADFPKPISLRFGDVIRLTSNTPYFIKMKHVNRDCQIIKCERVDPHGGENTKLKLPTDFEVNMVMTVDSNSRRMISLQDLLTDVVAIPTHSVASVPDASEGEVLKDLPVDLRILKSMKETCIVVAPETGRRSPSTSSLKSCSSSDSGISSKGKTSTLTSLRHDQELITNIGLPLTSEVVLAFRDRLDIFELDLRESGADYLRLPVEKMTLTQFEERERLRKLNADYEDVEFGSNSTIDECGSGSGSITRAGSAGSSLPKHGYIVCFWNIMNQRRPVSMPPPVTRRPVERNSSSRARLARRSYLEFVGQHENATEGVLDKKQKTTTMNKMIRLSRALNPKHWRHSKAEPEPLPHPSAMGLMALAARPKEDTRNDYHHTQVDLPSARRQSGQGGSNISSSEEDENFYEDVEIGPIRSSTMAVPAARQSNAFSGPAHRSLPPRMSQTRSNDPRARIESASSSQAAGISEATGHRSSRTNSNTETHTYDVPSPFTKAKNWASNLGNNTAGDRPNTKPRYDVPKSRTVKEENVQATKPTTVGTSTNVEPPNRRLPLLPPKVNNKVEDTTEKKEIGTTPIPPSRRKDRKPSSWVNNPVRSQSVQEEQDKLPTTSILKSVSSSDSIPSSPNDSPLVPKPKPRALKKPEPFSELSSPTLQSQAPKSSSTDIVQSVETLSIDSHHSSVSLDSSSRFVANNNGRPKPPPKPVKVSTHTTV